MFLVLYLIDKNKARWLALENASIKFFYNFDLEFGKDSLFEGLDTFLVKNKLELKSFSGLILAVEDPSLTQVKVATTMVNTLAWYFKWPVVGEYYFSGHLEDVLVKLSKDVSKLKKFTPLKVKYQRQPDITISKKRPNFRIKK
jgi:hypothetical protein